MAIIDNAVYVDGHRTADPADLDETLELLRARHGFAWIGLRRPDEDELARVAAEFDLHPLAVDDTRTGRQRPKLERYGDVRFVSLRPARYVDAEERIEFGEVHLFIGPDFAVSVRHAENPDLQGVRRRLEDDPELLRIGPLAVLYGVLDLVVDQYAPVLDGLQQDIDEIEDQLFGGDEQVSRRIYELSREVTLLQRAVNPLREVLHGLADRRAGEPELDLELRRRLRDVADHVVHVTERTEGFRGLLQNALTVHATLVGQRQNDETKRLTEASLAQGDQTKKISSWAAIGFAPSLVGTIYGMNFRFMPELEWPFGYPLALGAMLAIGVGLFVAFRRRGWV